jgi:hypothetical protein
VPADLLTIQDSTFKFKVGQNVAHKTDPLVRYSVIERSVCFTAENGDLARHSIEYFCTNIVEGDQVFAEAELFSPDPVEPSLESAE